MPRKGENIYKRKMVDGKPDIYIITKTVRQNMYPYTASYTEAKAKRQEELSKPDSTRISVVKQMAHLMKYCSLWLNNVSPM